MGKNRKITSFTGIIFFSLLLSFIALIPFRSSAATPVNVKDYGAVGDGITDDCAAIQAAINAAAAGQGGGVITFPAGVYLVNEIIVLKSNITLSLDKDATILNGINIPNHPSIIFLTGPYDDDQNRYVWPRTQNIKFIGGNIDMNGTLNVTGNACANLPNIGSSGAFALGYCDGFSIQNVNFYNSYKGHTIQVCDSSNVTIENCNFRGQAIPNTLTNTQTINLETIQIEPSTLKGFPYALNDTGSASHHVTIKNCYFGSSSNCGEPVTAIGTHNQLPTSEKCNNISIIGNTFDNPMYAGVRFCGYEDVNIAQNTFVKKNSASSINYRSEGCFLINAYCYNNTSDEMDLNRRINIQNNTFNINDPVTRAIRVAKDKDTYIGNVSNITITDNSITNTSPDTKDVGIHIMRVNNDIIVTGNTINGGYRGIELQYCTGNITLNNNTASGLAYQTTRIIACGNNQKINLFTHGEGSINVSTSIDRYTFTAVPNAGRSFVAFYGENALTTQITKNNTLTYVINKTTNVSRHALFQ